MIRNNKVTHQCSHSADIETVNFKNAVFQGEYDRNRGRPDGSGLIYLTEEHHFIAFGQIKDQKISGCTLFFQDNHRYHYGIWKYNQPNGLQIFRINDVLILADYNQGILLEGSKILLIFQRVNIGVIIEIGLFDNWKIVSKSQVYCSEHVQMLIRQCGFKPNQVFLTVVQYINNKLADSLSEIKFKLIDNQYYRLGFHRGLAIIFDDDSNIISRGVHNQNSLATIGVKFKENGLREEHKGQVGTIVINRQHRPAHKVGKVYSRHELNEFNFKNQVYIDPSLPYFQYYENLLTSPIMKQIFSGFIITSPIDLQSSVKKKSPQIKIEDTPDKMIATFHNQSIREKSSIQAGQSKHTLNLSLKHSKQLESLDLNRKIFEQGVVFENLPEKNRLHILKSEQDKSLNNRNLEVVISKHYAHSSIQRSKATKTIKDTLTDNNRKLKTQSSKPAFLASNIQNKLEAEQDQFDEIIAKTPKSEQTAQKQLHNRSNSRTKKKIFGQTNSSIKQYSLSPQNDRKSNRSNKSRTKSKIFAPPLPAPFEKKRVQIQKEHRAIEKNIELKSINDDSSFKQNSQCLSPYNKLKFSIDKSQNDSKHNLAPQQIKQNLPEKKKQLVVQSEGIEQQDVREIKNIRKLQIEGGNGRYKRDNMIYKNSISRSPYANYIHEPIVIKQPKNAIYMKQLTPQRSTISPNSKLVYLAPANDPSQCKKSISNTSPYKKPKMSSYMDEGDLIAANDSSKMRNTKQGGRRFNYF